VLGWREIQVASLGEDQLSLGATAPSRALMAEVISAWRAGKRTSGGWRAGWCSSFSESESETSFSSRGGAGCEEVEKEGSQSSSSLSDVAVSLSSFLLLPSSARMMPSSCSQAVKSGVKGMMRERMQEVRYLSH
jgi:hypothetical protein